MTSPLIRHFTQLLHPVSISPETLEKIHSIAKVYRYSRGSYLLQPNQIDTELRFIVSGIVRGFHYEEDEDGQDVKDVTTWLAAEHDFATDMSSFFLRQPTTTYIEVLEPILIISVSRHDAEPMLQDQVDSMRISRKLLELHISHLEQRLKLLQIRDAHKKIDLFYHYHGCLANRVSQKHIASFLNIHSVTLSRIREERR